MHSPTKASAGPMVSSRTGMACKVSCLGTGEDNFISLHQPVTGCKLLLGRGLELGGALSLAEDNSQGAAQLRVDSCQCSLKLRK